MGLDITAYRGLQPAPRAELDGDGYPVDWEEFYVIQQSTITYTEQHFGGRTEGLVAGVYSFAEEFGFRAGSYGGYNGWRNWLARVAGYDSAQSCWDDPDPSKPFLELIEFSDCEGYIGPKVAAKLALDFKVNFERAAATHAGGDDDGPWLMQKYHAWAKAFELAADGGVVVFH